ncbi:MAG: hypothetical protein ACLUUF_02585 [Bifidobacterium pullorum]
MTWWTANGPWRRLSTPVRWKGAYVSAEFREDADEYVQGDISIEELMRRTKRRWQVKREVAANV